jgi:solute carrier family 35 (UDP-sugar transporter), member A1/2/3
MYMLLLAIQYSLQPRFSKKYISPSTSKQSVALVEEVVKTGMAAAVFFTKPNVSMQGWTLSSSLAVAAVPAILYAIQGVLQYMSHQHLDPVTFNGLSQTKTLSAALCCFVVLGTPQSPLQMVALLLLLASSLVFQGNMRKTTNDSFVRGILPCLGATLLSGLAGALSQKGLQLTGGGHGRDAFLYTMEVSFYSAVTLFVSILFSSRGRRNDTVNTTSTPATPKKQLFQTATTNWFHGWTWQTWIPILIKAYGGVLTALVHKYAGSVAKGFALMFGLVLSQLVSSMIQEQDVTMPQLVGTMLVMLSGWMHFTNPPL